MPFSIFSLGLRSSRFSSDFFSFLKHMGKNYPKLKTILKEKAKEHLEQSLLLPIANRNKHKPFKQLMNPRK